MKEFFKNFKKKWHMYYFGVIVCCVLVFTGAAITNTPIWSSEPTGTVLVAEFDNQQYEMDYIFTVETYYKPEFTIKYVNQTVNDALWELYMEQNSYRWVLDAINKRNLQKELNNVLKQYPGAKIRIRKINNIQKVIPDDSNRPYYHRTPKP